ncbi:MAG: AmmeMemoRadiSam system protein A [Erysipelotrichaceae bacterium]|nr:AmmeMemoRadiSam system protein A [Erysipelotrichaceae bacterium]
MSILAGFMVPHPPLIVPAIGKGEEAQIKETTAAYEEVARQIAELEPDTIIISSPHSIMYADYFHISPGKEASGDFSGFRAPQITFEEKYDTELVDLLCDLSDQEGLPAGILGERDPDLDHGTMVPLWFIRQQYKKGGIVRIGLSGLDLPKHYKLGMLIKEACDALDRKAVFVASGDLSHKLQEYGPYGFASEGPEYDKRIMDVCSRAAFNELFDFSEDFCDKAAECGHRSFVIMAGAFDGLSVKAEELSHQDVTGVGYGICTFYPLGKDENRHFLKQYEDELIRKLTEKKSRSDAYVNLARYTIETYVLTGKRPALPEGLPEEMLTNKAGTFVSIHENDRLRGCIGTIRPTKANLAQEIISNAISACAYDNRFVPVKAEELPYLEINVDVLGEAEDIESKEELDVKRYGVIVSNGNRLGLLLPDLEGVDTVEQQIRIAAQKGRIDPDEEDYHLQRFEVIRHE